jgi:hypothetical protein
VGQTCVFGGEPNFVEQPQKSLVCVSSWTWTSSPITVVKGSGAAVAGCFDMMAMAAQAGCGGRRECQSVSFW